MAETLVYWLWEKTHVQEVMSSNLSTIYVLDLFPLICCKILYSVMEKAKINE